ncbi:c-type cytochrome [Phenylobacterium sp.]|uniref:c-type cytochrome n=1 Tax=Phenylobacterium sp. TaxID=1871053 RepID=UPI0025F1DF77|nr:c-type cytochrome [Phenylobacterium sp.]
MRTLVPMLGLAMLLAACASTSPPAAPVAPRTADGSGVPPLPTLDPAQTRGHNFAVQRCSGCHAVGLDDGGPQGGPAFYRLSRRYNPLQLEHRFSEVSAHGFDRMPAISFTAAEAEDLIAYFDSLNGN